jgi:hypothetical protein
MLSDREAFPKGSISVYCIQPEILMLKRVATATLTLHGVSFRSPMTGDFINQLLEIYVSTDLHRSAILV